MNYKDDVLFMDTMKSVLEEEGGFVNHPNDRGGATKFGITLRSYREIKPDADETDVRNITKEEAYSYYYHYWWAPEKPNMVDISYRDLASKYSAAKRLFIFAINMGQKRANKLLQRAIWAADAEPIEVDGLIGPETLSRYKSANDRALIAALRSEVAGYYRWIVAVDPSQKVFLKGWLRRAYEA